MIDVRIVTKQIIMKKLITITAVLLGIISLQAQHEIGIGLGTSHLLGDFGGGPGEGTLFIKDLDLKSTQPSASLFYRYHFAKVLALRGQFLYAGLSSNDLYSAEQNRFDRGLNSKASLMDLSAQLELHFIPLRLCSGKTRVSPYIAGGIGFARANPTIGGQGEEGFAAEELQYIDDSGPVSALNIPMAMGVKVKTPKNVVIGLEASYRMAFTDRLDNYVRQNNDHLLFIQAQVSYVFCKGGGAGKMSKEMRCPTYH